MTLKDCDVNKLLPLFMRSDTFNQSLANCMSRVAKDLYTKTDKLQFWTRIDKMSEKELDECAYEFNVTWYKYDATINQKREIIKMAKEVRRRIGTKWALEYVLDIYFNDASVLEYWEYGGQKKHFIVQTYNNATVDEDAAAFLKIVNSVKRCACVLDYIEVLEKSTNEILYVISNHTVDIVRKQNGVR